MRLVVGSVLLASAVHLWSDTSLQTVLISTALAGCGLLLGAGLWTPIAGGVVAVIGILQVVTRQDHPLVALLAATITGALAMLGPGRFSVDARLFGWKRIELPPRDERSTPSIGNRGPAGG